MPSLENLKKQAKQYLRWHREGRHTVAAIIRSCRPGFEERSDREILEAPFKLVDAQKMVARRLGFEDWARLTEGLPTLAADKTPAAYPAQPILLNVEPTLFVADFQRSLTFFTSVLGFKVAFTYGEPPLLWPGGARRGVVEPPLRAPAGAGPILGARSVVRLDLGQQRQAAVSRIPGQRRAIPTDPETRTLARPRKGRLHRP
jgi:catechol 2,3-dioxygenase-like lactoylglutathione lyase family enzyme